MTTEVNATRDSAQRGQLVYQNATALGGPLETVRSARPPALEFEGVSKFQVTKDIQSITSILFRARKTGSKFLSDEEWAGLTSHRPFWPEPALVEQCLLMRQPWRLGVPAQDSRVILFDARVLQSTRTNGTINHALAVLLAFLDIIPSHFEVAFFTSPALPNLPAEISRRATVNWRPALIGDVDVYVQLATISHASDSANVDLLRAPWIRRISVFLDDIQGIYPEHFAGTERMFWLHQIAIEKLRTSDVVLTLGKTSLAEAKALWATQMSDEKAPVFITTSCLMSVPESDAAASGSGSGSKSSELLVFGNYHPHKNLALAACAVGAGREFFPGQTRFTFLADLTLAQRNAIADVATQAAGADQTDGITFSSGLSDVALSRRMRESIGVIIPSLHEGFSIPVLEAVSLGAPVLLSRIPAHQELLPEGPWFFDPTDVASLEASLRALAQSGREWAHQQAAHLANNYSAHTLPRAISAALETVTNQLIERNGLSGMNLHSGRPPKGSHRSKSSTVEDLTIRDRELISAKLSLADTEGHVGNALGKPMILFKNEHDNIVAEFHASLTWRVGKAVLAPVRWFKNFTVRR